jgi:hypothetical protein
LHVQMMRQAISPRLATRIFLNLRGLNAIENRCRKKAQKTQMAFLCLLCRVVA